METEFKLPWAAGLFEGNGSIRYHYDQFSLKLTTPDEDVIRGFHDAVGFGGVRMTKGARWEWTCGKQKDCREIMIMLWPYLGTKKKDRWQEVLGLRFQAFKPRLCPSCEKLYEPIRKAQVCCSQKCAISHTKKVGKYTDRKVARNA